MVLTIGLLLKSFKLHFLLRPGKASLSSILHFLKQLTVLVQTPTNPKAFLVVFGRVDRRDDPDSPASFWWSLGFKVAAKNTPPTTS
jgi:hypothetical protein